MGVVRGSGVRVQPSAQVGVSWQSVVPHGAMQVASTVTGQLQL
jgi:hypothetical protein